jgi:uncharacterized lipoprotein
VVLKCLTIALMVIFLTGCMVSYPSNDKQAYLKSKNATKLVVPAPLQADEISSFYFLPEAEGNKKVSLKP